jgi:hypothetical protein
LPDITTISLLEFHHPHIANSYKEKACKEMKKEWLRWKDAEVKKRDGVRKAIFKIQHPERNWQEDRGFMKMLYA